MLIAFKKMATHVEKYLTHIKKWKNVFEKDVKHVFEKC